MSRGKSPVAVKRRLGPVGGSASTGGAVYGASVAAWAATRMLLGPRSSLPWELGSQSFICSIWAECEEEVDDLRLDLLPAATVYVQIKHGLQMGAEFDKAVAQLARQEARTVLSESDRLVIVTNATASGPVRVDVSKALSWFHGLPQTTPLSEFPHGARPRAALDRIIDVFESEFKETTGIRPSEDRLRRFLARTHLTVLDTMGGPDEHASIQALHGMMGASSARLAWTAMCDFCLEAGRLRRPLDAATLETHLRRISLTIFKDASRSAPTLTESARALSSQRIMNLIRAQQYDPAAFVAREALDNSLNEARDKGSNFLIVAGGSGEGKTTWCAWQCEQDAERPRVLLAAESIADVDRHLRDTLARLLNIGNRELHRGEFAPAEVQTWFRSSRLEVFVDGLDRAVIQSKKLLAWLRESSADAHECNWLVIFTTRPEVLEGVRASLGHAVPIAGSTNFTEFEAFDAARKLGIPEVAKYRHPRMMAFCAKLWVSRGPRAFRKEEAVEAFIDDAVVQASSAVGLLLDKVNVAIQDLGQALARSDTGALEGSEIRQFHAAHPQAYEALRNSNILILNQGTLRVEIDEIAEHLAAKHTDIAVAIARWPEISMLPLKAGALRSALEQLAVASPDEVTGHVGRLAGTRALADDAVLISLLCSVLCALENPSSLRKVAEELVAAWDHPNMVALWGEGADLLHMAANGRWDPMDRVELLWKLAVKEDAYDWRQKHWLWETPGFRVSPWRKHFLEAVRVAGPAGLKFLLSRFALRDRLLDGSEAVLGDLAQGAFLLSARFQVEAAMRALAVDIRPISQDMLDFVALRYPAEVADVLGSGAQFLDLSVQVKLVTELRLVDRPHPAGCALARLWLERGEFAPWVRELLRMLATAGDITAGERLLQIGDFTQFDATAICGLDAQAFASALPVLLTPATTREDVLRGLSLGNTRADQVPALAEALLAVLVADAPARIVAEIAENMTRAMYWSDHSPGNLLALLEQLLKAPDPDARKPLIYLAATHKVPDELTTGGRRLLENLRELILTHESDPENLHLLCSCLLERQSQVPQTRAYLTRLGRANPHLDLFRNPRVFDSKARALAAELRAELRGYSRPAEPPR